MTIDRTNKNYVSEVRNKAETYIYATVTQHLKNGGGFDAGSAARTLMHCIEWARLSTDMLVSAGLLDFSEKAEEQEDKPCKA